MVNLCITLQKKCRGGGGLSALCIRPSHIRHDPVLKSVHDILISVLIGDRSFF